MRCWRGGRRRHSTGAVVTETFSPYLAVVMFLPAFAVFWCLVIYLISRIGGWASLAEDFSTARPPPPEGETFSWTSGKVNFFSNYNNSLVANVSRSGLYVTPWTPFRIGHTPLFIPWAKVHGIIQGYYFFRPYTHLAMMTPAGEKSITLYGRHVSESLARQAPTGIMRRNLA